MLRDDQVAKQPRADGIEAAERLVEDQEIRLVNDRSDESGSSASMPFDSSSHFLPSTPVKPDALDAESHALAIRAPRRLSASR